MIHHASSNYRLHLGRNRLNLSRWRPLSYRNQPIDLIGKSMDWFLYDNGLHLERVKQAIQAIPSRHLTCSKQQIETAEQCVKSAPCYQLRHQKERFHC